ncbi:MAG TPA: tetratricopeptide repeat-containing sensor histidine kinase [Chitinophagaceae bacterium]|nr:tetratricopeptide repeat-containing sensor histidine kinase [Chitinophagaceae bacterium]
MKKKSIIIIALFCLQLPLHAQKKGRARIDSLIQVLQANPHDTMRVKTQNLLSFDLKLIGKVDSALELSSSSLELAKKINFTRGEADAYFFLGQAYLSKGKLTDALISYLAAQKLYEQLKRNIELAETFYAIALVHQHSNYDESLSFLKKALVTAQQTPLKDLSGKIAYTTAVVLIRKSEQREASQYKDLAIKYYTESGNQAGLANCYVVSARLNNYLGNVQQSVKDNYTALRIFEKLGNNLGMYNVHTGLGLMYEDQKNWKEALNSYLAAKKAAEGVAAKEVLGGAYNNLGNAYRELGNIEEAHTCFKEALKLSEQAADKKGIATAQGNLGTIYSLMGNQTEALKAYDEARKRFEEIGSKESASISYLESGSVLFDMKRYDEAKQTLEKGLVIAKQVGYKEIISKSYELLSQIDTAKGDYASALQNYNLYITYRDSVSNAESAKQLSEQRLQYAFSKKEDSMRLQQALIAEQLEKQTLLSKQQQQELKLKQASLELTQREKDVQMLTFLKTQAELQLSNEQNEKKLALAEQEKALQQSQLDKQTLLARQKEQELLLKDRKLAVQKAQRNIWLAGAIGFLVLSFIMFRNYRQKQKANHLLQKQNIELEDQRDQVKKAMAELQQTQIQLIQKEKMASLGELTAGIAHEIQNPLNFVNNFSEVNFDLGNELKAELTKLSLSNEKQQMLHNLTDELLQNQQKITHHGKRAEAIVKNMLQHSRKSNGVKEPTDINALVDECLRLSYRGFRNKHKAFETKIETDLDNSASGVHVIPEDLSRVLVNLLNNAFYAVNEKKKQLNGTFEPAVIVSTKKEGNKIMIAVKDNGTGMTEKVTGKVFQPFFTTKPAGEGTGLGLSLSYDLVTKGHGGELKVESKEGEGAKFTIQLPV